MAELLLVRHAATAWSGRRYCGRSDPPLDDTGLAALTRLASELRPWLRPGLRIVSSPLKRARQTAAAIASVVVPTSVELDARWAEVDFGIADGLTFDEFTLVAPVIAARLAAGEVAIDWPGGETAAALTDRVETVWRDLASRGSPALVVSHGGPLRVAIGLATGRPQFEVQVPPTAGIWRGNLSPSAVTGRSEDLTRTAGSGSSATIPRVKRRRSSAPGRLRPDGRLLSSTLLIVLAMVLAACGQATSTDQPTASDQPAATDATNLAETPATSSGEPSSEGPTESVDAATPAPPSETASPSTDTSADPGNAAACSGSDENRDFFASMAAAVDWAVYCPVLPDGWFVDDGQYRLAGGGWMRIGYDGPGDARILLQQGAFCPESGGCVPPGHDVGETALGDRIGVLVAGDDGGWSVVVDRGATRSWLLIVSGLDESSARSIAADLLAITG